MDKLQVILPCAGLGRRMKSYGPKSLIDLGGGQLLLHKQLDILHKIYPQAEIIIVLGFDADKVYKTLPNKPYIHVVENEFYDETNVARSLSLGLKAAGLNSTKVLIVYGDLVFNEATFQNLSLTESCVIINTDKQIRDFKVGVTVVDGYISRFSYGLPIKWGQITYLAGKEVKLFRAASNLQEHKKYYGFELLNIVLEQGGTLKAVEPDDMKLYEIDSSKDIGLARKLIKDMK
jgi:choline kinase